jgi:hypothetical protein
MDAIDVMMANGATVEEAFAQAFDLLNNSIIPKLLPAVSEGDNGKIMQVVNGKVSFVDVKDSAVATYVDEYISSALDGDY